MKHLLLLSLLAIGLCAASQAQLRRFSLIPEEFMAQLYQLCQSSPAHQQELEKAYAAFQQTWESAAFADPERKEEIIKTCNLFLEKRAKASPHFLNYLVCLNSFSTNLEWADFYADWNKGLNHAIVRRNIRIADGYMEQTQNLMNDGTIYKSNSVHWRLVSGKISFEFDEVPLINFDNATIAAYSKGDSTTLYDTEGVLEPFDNQWTGKGGKIYWIRAGFAKEHVWAELGSYNIRMTMSQFNADSVTFYNTTYYDKPMLGSLEEKLIANVSAENASYPRFDSYEKLYEINELYAGVDYKGGFSMRGARFIGSGNNEQDAMLYFKRNDTVAMVCRSKIYVISKDQVVGRNTSITFYLDKDSIYHPGLQLKYVVRGREVSLIRDGDPQSMSRSPYYNTFHKVDMDVELMTWQIDRPEILMGAMRGSIVSRASFESENYFRESRYLELEMLDRMHPLVSLRRFAEQRGGDEFYADDFARFIKLPLTEVRHLCLMLSFKGIITYDINTDKISIRQRLYDYLQARVGRIDYDVIKFDSEHDMIGLESANLRLTDYYMKVYGVPRIAVSDSQNVIIYPRGRQLILKKNRDFEFDGIIEAGLFTFFGQGFDFSYENFMINLKNIDSLKIKVRAFEEDAYGMRNQVDIQNVVENITGKLMIDDPQNKSSIRRYPQYPIFTSEQDSYVYYDYPHTQNGVYSRDKFYFAIDPYEVDSLNSFTTEGLNFEGSFVSAGIFEPFREKLMVQEDYSLGFKRETGPGGYPVYGGKGVFEGDMQMWNRGLMGNGTVNYLNSMAKSERFIFLIDSMNAVATEYAIEKKTAAEGTEFPELNAKDVFVHWQPYNDVWEIEQRSEAISMYNGMAILEGGTAFTPEGLGGWGKFQFGQARLTSDTYTFKEHEVLADTAAFDLLASGEALSDFAFKTQNIKAYVDFEQKKGVFTSNDEITVVQFPQNKYICYLDRFTWDMETEEILLGSSLDNTNKDKDKDKDKDKEPEQLGGAHFISVHPRQDTLNFVAPQSTYDLKNYIIHAKDVQHINVADSRVFPGEKGKVTIHSDAKMETLKDAEIITPISRKYHTVHNATLNITGRLAYSGSGKINYEDKQGKIDTLMLALINIDSTGSTYGTGEIAEADSFALGPEFSYQGKFRMNAPRRYLSFSGASKLQHGCDTMPAHWFKFEDEINPNNIAIPVTAEPKDLDNKRLYNSIYLTRDSVHIYSSFLGKRQKFNDHQIIAADGYLQFNEAAKRYEIASKDKLRDNLMPGNMLAFNTDYCYTYAEGKMELGLDIGQVKTDVFGTITHNLPEDKVHMETVFKLDFFFPQELMRIIADTLANNASIKAADLTRPTFTKKLYDALGANRGREVAGELQLYGAMRRLPVELQSAITFCQLDMYWDQPTSAYRSMGEIGISSILDRQVNKMVKGYLELQKRRTGDQIDIYIEVSDRDWFFFSYTREVMQVVSSFDEFNDFIDKMKDDKKKMKVGRRDTPYSFYLSSDTRKDIFVKRFQRRENVRAGLIEESEEIDY
jgi:hypothetical protein